MTAAFFAFDFVQATLTSILCWQNKTAFSLWHTCYHLHTKQHVYIFLKSEQLAGSFEQDKITNQIKFGYLSGLESIQ
jgi:hypothetical protein